MPDENQVEASASTPEAAVDQPTTGAAKKTTARKSAAKKTATKAAAKKAPAKKAAASDEQLPLEAASAVEPADAPAPAKKAAAKRAPRKKAAAAPPATEAPAEASVEAPAATVTPDAEAPADQPEAKPAKKAAAKKAPAKKTAAKKTAAKKTTAKKAAAAPEAAETPEAPATGETAETAAAAETGAPAVAVLFQAPQATTTTTRTRRSRPRPAEEPAPAPVDEAEEADDDLEAAADVAADGEASTEAVETSPDTEATGDTRDTESDDASDSDDDDDDEDGDSTRPRRRRRRGGRRRRKSGGEGGEAADGSADAEQGDEAAVDAEPAESADSEADGEGGDDAEDSEESGEGGSSSSRRRRRRRRTGDGGDEGGDDPQNTVTRVRSARSAEDQITAVSGSTRLEAKKQRRREGREAGRRRAPIVSEAEFLARREAVERVMVVRQRGDLTQIGVLEDKVLVEHYVARESQTSLIGNVYLGRVQNVLPSMEAAFIDIGKGRNAVLYAGEVNWQALGHREGQARKIESVLSSGQPVLVQVTKDPIGHKGARLTSQVSLAGRFLVYVPDGTTSGISRKLPDTERSRLKSLLKEIVPDTAGVIVRTAAEGASEEELTQDVERLKARWEDIEAKSRGNAPQLLYGEPDLTLKVVRDLFTEDFTKLVVEGDDAWQTVSQYVEQVAPDLVERLERFERATEGRDAGKDSFAVHRIEEQIAKGLDRKVWLPSGGSLVIDRTEAMTVVDVNTGKFTGSGGNLEETVTKNNLEAAEEIVRQLRLRDIGGIIVVDFIDMVLESNRDLVLRRLVECLGRDRTRHQVAEVTSLGLVQMTRKRIGTGLVESFSENCETCHGRGVVIHEHPVDPKRGGGGGGVVEEEPRRSSRRSRGGRGRGEDDARTDQAKEPAREPAKPAAAPTPKDVAAMARAEAAERATQAEPTQAEPEQAAEAPLVVEPVIEQSSGAPDAVPTVEAVLDTPAPEAVASEPQPEAQQPSEPAAPRVVTRTRRAATRPAGQPAATTPVAIVVTPAPAEAPAEAAAAAPAAPAPTVTTRTRSSRRAPSAAAPAAASAESPEAPAGEGSVEHPPEHVPVKKKGARKR